MGLERYRANRLLRAAVERQFEIIGETLNQLSSRAPNLTARIPELRAIVSFRNLLIHGYASVDDAIVWRTVTEKLPALREALDGLLATRKPPMTDRTAPDRGDAAPVRGVLARRAPGLARLLAYRRDWLMGDLLAGLSVAAVALPVGISYAGIVGLPPEAGIHAAIFPMLAYALLGSSRHLVVGPDAATCILLAASVAPLAAGDPARHAALVGAATLLTGILFLAAGAVRLGFVANFLSRPILTGFMNGIAIVVAAGQLPKLLGYASHNHDTLPRLLEFVQGVSQAHGATALVGLGSAAALLVLKRLGPQVPGALLVIAAAIALSAVHDLGAAGVALTSPIPASLPLPSLPVLEPAVWRDLLGDAARIILISFTGGMLSAQSFARRTGESADADTDLVAGGAANLIAGLTQGFAVAGTDSCTAVNIAAGAQTQLSVIVAALAMIAALFLLGGPLALAPAPAFAAVVLVSVLGLFDVAGLRRFWAMSRREGLICGITTVGVVVLGVLPGVLLAVVLSLLWLLSMAMKPLDAVLGRVPGLPGHHDLTHHPDAVTKPGLLLYRFESNIVFFNADLFAGRVLAAVEAAPTPVRWVVMDLAPVSFVDATAVMRIDELRADLAARGVTLAVAAVRQHVARAFSVRWARDRAAAGAGWRFPTIDAATAAFDAAQTTGLDNAGRARER